ncbi:hypothetical protein [Pseudomonas aeruginosa]|uniref:hypothetical protein n=1 Tax=Pseudomonas aeruginosa TaxID=287 RepID=UPI00044E3A76|nr:hypothetical protein [Pseudomonas aeruginosa]EZO95082.1 hypothetical protein V554_02789 [Pseudomonas aeruginosa BWH053]
MSKFKSGDLALVVGGDLFLGQQVEVRSWVNPGDLYHVAKDGSHYYLNPESQHSGWSVTRAEKYADGLLQRPRREVESVVRSAVSHTAETASDKAFEANSDIISHVEWLSTLDSRTSTTCRIRDRLPYTLGTYQPIGHKIPWLAGPGRIHFCCRSTKIPILKSAMALGISDAATRASMDGQVPQQTTYAQWLARQPAARQDEILGPERGKLLRQDKLKLEDFYNERGKFLTLDQLHERLK